MLIPDSCFLGPPPFLEAAAITCISESFHAEPRRHTMFYKKGSTIHTPSHLVFSIGNISCRAEHALGVRTDPPCFSKGHAAGPPLQSCAMIYLTLLMGTLLLSCLFLRQCCEEYPRTLPLALSEFISGLNS